MFLALYPLHIQFNSDNIFKQAIGCLVHTLLKRSTTMYISPSAALLWVRSPNMMHKPSGGGALHSGQYPNDKKSCCQAADRGKRLFPCLS